MASHLSDAALELLGFGYVREMYGEEVLGVVTFIIIEFSKIFIDSVILSPEEQRNLAKMIESQPQTAKFKNCEWNLLCRGSRDGVGDYHAFHKLCDGKKNTVCLVDISTGYVSGGFASAAWQSTDYNTKCKDDAFLFVLRPLDKVNVFHRQRNEKGELCDAQCGILHNRTDGFNFGYNRSVHYIIVFFWGNYNNIPCTRLIVKCKDKEYFDCNNNVDLCGDGSPSEHRTVSHFKEFEVFQLIQK